MQIYEVKFGISHNVIDDRWLVRAKDFVDAAKKATKTANDKDSGYTEPGRRDVVSLTLIGREE